MTLVEARPRAAGPGPVPALRAGQPARRLEDRRLLRGAGAYLDDLGEDALAGWVLRSPHAHARIVALDAGAARARPGVVAVLTAAELQADGLGPIPASPVATLAGPGLEIASPAYPLLAGGEVRFVGDPVAFVVAETPDAAREAGELIEVDYEELPAVTDPADPQAEPGYALLHGDPVATAVAFAGAAHIVETTVANPRVSAAPLETRSALARPDGERTVLIAGTQAPHLLRRILADDVFGTGEASLRVVTPDVGGGFGAKAPVYREQGLVVWAARRLGRAVGWQADRSEAFLADTAGRAMRTKIALALAADGTLLGLRAEVTADLGAYLSFFGGMPASMGLSGLVGVYRIPAVEIRSAGRFTNTAPVCAYRGAGRPEAIYALERAIDHAARAVGLHPVELRRRNLVPAAALPYATPMGTVYDSGDFPALLEKALRQADVAGFVARRAAAAGRGLLLGLGMSCYVERCAAGAEDAARVVLDGEGGADVMLGTMTAGQGHATAYTQMVAARLGLDPARIRIHQGDTDVVARGVGTFGSRSLPVGGSALHRAMEALIEKARPLAADLLEAAAADLEFEAGRFTVGGTDYAVTLAEVARRHLSALAATPERLRGSLGADLTADGAFKPVQPTYPNGCHICEVEVDPETGRTALVRYTATDDFGAEINPMLVDGQVHGGVAQGIGQALLERVVYDASGQLVSGSFMDYAMPRADDLPSLQLARRPERCPSNPLGVKGCGEAGATAAPPAVMNAVMDALAQVGVEEFDMPATPGRVWEAIRRAQPQPA